MRGSRSPSHAGPRAGPQGKTPVLSGARAGSEPIPGVVTAMNILTRYVIRAHIGPFLFAFSALTGLIFLNAVAQRLDDLVGRGLGVFVIGEFFLLSLPHVVALTFPMSILVATLYAFSQLTGNNEVAAIASGGIHPGRLIVPLVFIGIALGGTVYFFNDKVLPEANHRLSSLLTDIGSKSPTFQLREEIVNEIHTDDDTRYFLRASTIDSQTSELEDVTIFDLSETGESRTITAKYGHMAWTADLRDLVLTLEDGVIYEISDNRPGMFQRLLYETQILPFSGVARELERQTGGSRSDREMTVGMLQVEVENSLSQLISVENESLGASREALEIALRGLTAAELALGSSPILPPDTASEPILTSGSRLAATDLERDVAGLVRIHRARSNVYRLSAAQKLVEIHKKYAISFACIIFVLLGPPLAMRFPRGGVGMVIAASVGIFFVYWMGLIGGERFADEGQVHPILAMWASNVALLLLALTFLWNIADRVSTNRGSGWSELLSRLSSLAVRRRVDRNRSTLGVGEA